MRLILLSILFIFHSIQAPFAANQSKDGLDIIKTNIMGLEMSELTRPTTATFNKILQGTTQAPLTQKPRLHDIFSLYTSLLDTWNNPSLRGTYKKAAERISTALMRIVCAQDGWELTKNGPGNDKDLIIKTIRAAYYAGSLGAEDTLTTLLDKVQDVNREKQKRYAAMLYLMGKFGVGEWHKIEEYIKRYPALFDKDGKSNHKVTYKEVYNFALNLMEKYPWLFSQKVDSLQDVITKKLNRNLAPKVQLPVHIPSVADNWRVKLAGHFIKKTVEESHRAAGVETEDNYLKTLRGKGSTFAVLEKTIKDWKSAMAIAITDAEFPQKAQRDIIHNLAYEIIFRAFTEKLNIGINFTNIETIAGSFTPFLKYGTDKKLSFELTKKALEKVIADINKSAATIARHEKHAVNSPNTQRSLIDLEKDLNLGQIKFITTPDKRANLQRIQSGSTGCVYIPNKDGNPNGMLYFKAYKFETLEVDKKWHTYRVTVDVECIIEKFRYNEMKTILEKKDLVYWYEPSTRTLLAVDSRTPHKYYKIMSDVQKLNDGVLDSIAVMAKSENLAPITLEKQAEIRALLQKAKLNAENQVAHGEALKKATNKIATSK